MGVGAFWNTKKDFTGIEIKKNKGRKERYRKIYVILYISMTNNIQADEKLTFSLSDRIALTRPYSLCKFIKASVFDEFSP